MPRNERSTLIRVPNALAARLRRLRDEMQAAHSEGRITVPNELADHIPVWWLIETALNEVEGRRLRSARPRAKQQS